MVVIFSSQYAEQFVDHENQIILSFLYSIARNILGNTMIPDFSIGNIVPVV